MNFCQTEPGNHEKSMPWEMGLRRLCKKREIVYMYLFCCSPDHESRRCDLTENSKKKYYTYKFLRIQAQRQCIERTKGTTNCSDVLSKIVKLTETILIKSLRIMLLHGKSAYNFGI